jgi:dolichyl-phosphate beta-glucosyltransferase
VPSLSIVIPAFNEEPRLARTLTSIERAWADEQMSPLTLAQVIVSDDGSSDRTTDIALGFRDRLPMVSVRLEKNRGKGAAVRTGVLRAISDLVLIYDADGAAPIEEVCKLLQAMQRESADIAIGSRVLGKEDALVTMRPHRRLIGRVYHRLCAALVPGILDTACGCKLFRREIASALFRLQRIDRFAFDVEILAIACRKHYKIVEVPLRWSAIPESKVRLIRDGLQMFWCLMGLYIRRLRGEL